jgi:hypothetical protein
MTGRNGRCADGTGAIGLGLQYAPRDGRPCRQGSERRQCGKRNDSPVPNRVLLTGGSDLVAPAAITASVKNFEQRKATYGDNHQADQSALP